MIIRQSPPSGGGEVPAQLSIRSRLLLLALVATVLPALLVVARFLQERDLSIADATGRLAIVAQDRAEDLAARVDGTAQLHFGLARADDLDTEDRQACSEFLADALAVHPQYTGILTIRPDGRLFCDSLRTGRDLDLRDRAYFQAALSTYDDVVLEPVFGRLTGLAVLQIAYPVRTDTGDLEHILLASLNLGQLVEEAASSVPGARLLLLDAQGTLLAESHPDAVPAAPGESVSDTELFTFVASRGARTRELAGPDGVPGVWAVADSPEMDRAGIYVVAGVPTSALVGPADRRFLENLALLGIVAFLIFVAVLVVAEIGIRRPIGRMSRMAQQLAAGDLSARVHPPLPQGELGALMERFNQAAASLEQQRADIERLDERLRHSQRLDSIGQLTGGLAHDFNNLLTVVMGNADLLATHPGSSAEQQRLAEAITGAAASGAQLTQRLLAFARKQPLDPRAVDANLLVAGMDRMLRRTLGEHIDVELIRAGGLWAALVDPGQLETALLNLCVNARDAMPSGGRLTIETANARLDEEYAARNPDVHPGQYVMLAVSDTGQGIPPDILPHVFDPFFTTKEAGKGTGLGLAMVYGFVKQSNGHVAIYSEPGQGTTVKVYLPRTTAPRAAEEALPAPAIVGGTETILLVEDDEAVRDFGARQLRAFGYRVIEASDGPTALEALRQHDDIQLLFTDVVMPGGMNGRELADAAVALRPGLRVLYTSGYTENAIVHHGRLDPGAQLLAKPYRRADLDRAIRTALGRTEPGHTRG